MVVTHDEVRRAVQEMTRMMTTRLDSVTSGSTTLRGWKIQGTYEKLEHGGRELFMATDGDVYRVTYTQSRKAGPRRFNEPQFEAHTSVQKISVFDVGQDNDEILDRLEATLSYQMSF